MELIKKIKKFSVIFIVLSMMSVILSGCVYANNKNWNDMTVQEKQEVKKQYQEVKGELEQEFAGGGFEDKSGRFILDEVGEELDNLAQIEIYSAETNELIQVVCDEEMLYQYNQCSFDSSYSAEHQKELKKDIEGVKEEYYIISYKYPVSRFGSKELEKNITITIYENTNVIKVNVSEESMKGNYIPQEFLTFYYEMSDKDMEFYHSLTETINNDQ